MISVLCKVATTTAAEVFNKQGDEIARIEQTFAHRDIVGEGASFYLTRKHQPRLRSSSRLNEEASKRTQNLKTQQQQQQQEHYEDTYLHSSGYPPHENSDEFFGHDISQFDHDLFTTETLPQHELDASEEQHNNGNNGPESASGSASSSRYPNTVGSRSGSRTDLYGVREYGDRRDMTRGREGYINMLHHKEKVFRPHVSLVHDEARLASPNDGFGNACRNDCGEMQWQCISSCMCIDQSARCDKEPQCEDGSDEFDCDAVGDMMTKMQKECEETGIHVMCPRTYRCINKEWLCDGDDDCGDYSDETHCGSRHDCTEDQFECHNGFCIPKQWVCDGENDCKDFSDEMHCNRTGCSAEHFTCNDGYCISIAFRCDGERDCDDNSDEDKCPAVINSCPEGEFKCRGGLGGAGGPSGQCILNRFRCDGDNDCGDWSDEEQCSQKPSQCTSSEFKCADGTCIPKRWKCDKEQDCDGGEDENECSHLNTGQPVTCATDEFTCHNGRCILVNIK